MTNAAIIQGALVDAKNVGVHKSLRLYIDVPQEMAAQVIEKLGWPTQANPIPVAVARLNPESEVMPDTSGGHSESQVEDKTPPPSSPQGRAGAKRSFAELPLPQQAALLCQDKIFQAFLREERKFSVRTDDEAAIALRSICKVVSRAELRPDTPAAVAFNQLRVHYDAWRFGQ